MAETWRQCIKCDSWLSGRRHRRSEFAEDENLEELGNIVSVVLVLGVVESGEDGGRGLLYESCLRSVSNRDS